MYKFKFRVNLSSHPEGGYTNVHFAATEQEARDRVAEWNAERDKVAAYVGHPVDGYVDLIDVRPITDEEFLEDCTLL